MDPVKVSSVDDTKVLLCLFLSNICCFTTTPAVRETLDGVKSLTILNSELSKNFINLTKSCKSYDLVYLVKYSSLNTSKL